MRQTGMLLLAVAVVFPKLASLDTTVLACPFCTAQSQTLSEEMRGADAVVLAQLVRAGTEPDKRPDGVGGFGLADPDTAMATFKIEQILRGADRLIGVEEVEAVYFGKRDTDKTFLITGIGEDRPDWTTPLPLSEMALDYVKKLDGLPEKGADRLEFFQEYLRCDDPMLMQDAYDEFARAPYADVIALKDRMKHDKLVEWIGDVELSPSRRRLFLTMLGVCGTPDDIPLLEHFLRPAGEPLQTLMLVAGASSLQLHHGIVVPPLVKMAENYERLKQQGMDALIACYLTLKGADGLPLIEELFLSDPDGDYKNAYSAIMALRFHGEETDVIPRERLLESVRLVLDNPTFADQVVLDLSRWEDWSVLDRLVAMFKSSKENDYARQPIVQYLLVAAEQGGEIAERASAAIKELEQLDPDTVARAQNLMAFTMGGRPAKAQPGTGDVAASAPADATVRPESADAQPAAVGIADPSSPDANAKPADSDSPQPSDPVTTTDAAPTDAASKDAATADAKPETAATAQSEPVAVTAAGNPAEVNFEPPSLLWVIIVPIVACLALMGCFWIILRGTAGRTS